MQRAVAIPLPVLLLMAVAITLPLHAQRGHTGGFHSAGSSFHSGGGFHSGGFASHPASRSFNGARSTHPAAPARFGAPYSSQPGRSFIPSSNLRMRARGSFRPNTGIRRPEYGARRPEYPDRDDHHHPHRPEYNYGTTFYTGTILPYGIYNPYWYGDLGFSYDDSYDEPNSDQDYSNPAYDNSNNYVADSAPEAPEPQSPDQPYSSPYNYGSPQASPPAPQSAAPSLPPEPVTLIFNNGAPNQQIHNYILSRSKLIVLDGPRREIPVAELDLEATQKANRAAGIDFNLPN